MTGATDGGLPDPLPLFPLRAVLFPGGLLSLKVFEARYVDLVSRCLRERIPFGVVCIVQGSEVRVPGQAQDQAMRFEPVGTLAHLVDVDAGSHGLLKVRCEGTLRFGWGQVREGPDGLWLASGVNVLAPDAARAPDERFNDSVQALRRAYAALALRGDHELPVAQSFDDAGWVANRWCELLPISLAARQQLMALPDPEQRLALVDEFLRGKQLI